MPNLNKLVSSIKWRSDERKRESEKGLAQI